MRTGRIKRTSIAVALGALAALLPFGANQAQAATSLFDFPCSSGGSSTGDFNNDGLPDLAVGAPGDDLEQVEVDGSITKAGENVGSINVVYSTTANGPDVDNQVSAVTRKFFSQNTPGIVDNAEKDDTFGFSLASGDFDGILGDDLAIGVPGENGSAGAVHVLYSGGTIEPGGTTTIGLAAGVPGTSAFNEVITQDTAGVDGNSEAGDLFGYAVAAGDLNGDGRSDLIVGAPREDFSSRRDAGVVHVIYGTSHGLDPLGPSGGGVRNDQVFEQGLGRARNPEIGRAESGDFFGAALAVGQFDSGGRVDFAAGSPGEDVGNAADAGGVRVIY